MKNSYKTLTFESESLYKEKGSRFIGLAIPCFSETEAKDLLKNFRVRHQQASHVCFAYRIGVNKETIRSNDDGEPSNTAGAPIMGQIQSFDLQNVLVAVVRYYGGTKLGVGGLIHAYRTAAKEAIEAGEIVERELESILEIAVDYAHFPETMNAVKFFKSRIIEQVQNEQCRIKLEIENSKYAELKNRLLNIDQLELISETFRT